MWISKDGDERKQELIDAAVSLYCEKGYDKTSINDIIAKVGVTKGAFYYYFKSKEDILEYITLQQAGAALENLQKIAGDKETTAVQKLNRLMADAGKSFMLSIDQRRNIGIAMENVENTKLARKINEKIVEKSRPLLQRIIEQGISEGTFNTAFPEESAELYIHLNTIFKSSMIKLVDENGISPEDLGEIRKKVLFHQDVIEKIFGLENGTLILAEKIMELAFASGKE